MATFRKGVRAIQLVGRASEFKDKMLPHNFHLKMYTKQTNKQNTEKHQKTYKHMNITSAEKKLQNEI